MSGFDFLISLVAFSPSFWMLTISDSGEGSGQHFNKYGAHVAYLTLSHYNGIFYTSKPKKGTVDGPAKSESPVDRWWTPLFYGVSAILLVVYRISLAHPPYDSHGSGSQLKSIAVRYCLDGARNVSTHMRVCR